MKRTKIRISLLSGVLLLMLSAVLLVLANNAEGFAQWYSVTVYAALVHTIGRFFGLLSFSAAEVLLYITAAVLVSAVIWMIRSLLTDRDAKKSVQNMLHGCFLGASILFFLYVVNCGVNYHRDSFAESIGLELEDYTVEELECICRMLTEEVNALAEQVQRDERGIMLLGQDIQADAVRAMERLAQTYPVLQGYYPQPKGLMIPWILSVQQISGIYSPFTIEANYNSGMVDYNIPFTACHELSHLRGFMQEEEANFIAYLACSGSDVTEFRYSGNLLAWIYCTNALYRADYECWTALRAELSVWADFDLKENSAYWRKYDGQVAEIADKVNDNYLKANGQTEGIKSYGRMVDLMAAYYKELY